MNYILDISYISTSCELQMPFEQHGSELQGSTYVQIFFNRYTEKFFGDL